MNIIKHNLKWRSGLSKRATTSLIVLHHAAAKNCTVEDIDRWHKGNGWSGIGYHFLVRKDGTVHEGRPIWSVGAHAEGRNSNSIGVCSEGNLDDEKLTAEQLKSLRELLCYLKKLYPNATIKGHREVGATGCPGKRYPLAELKEFWNNPTEEREELDMTQYEELKKEIAELKAKTGYYNYIDNNMNEAYKPTIQKLVNAGKLQGNEKGELMLTTDMMRILTILDRCGVLD